MITFCIPSKNNLRYLKHSIRSLRKNCILDNEIIVYIDSDTDGTENWLKQENVSYIKNSSQSPKGIAYGYNRCIEKATKPYVGIFHADMFAGKNYDVNLLKHIENHQVVAATRIEPPLHPSGKEKIVSNLGMYPEDFDENKFNEEVSAIQQTEKNSTTKGIFAPWIISKKDITEIGLFDELFHSYHEDSDMFNRLILNGKSICQSRDSLVYHFTCRGGKFQDGIESVTKDLNFHLMAQKSAIHYCRKWQDWINNDDYHYPHINPIYDTGVVIKNSGLCDLSMIERFVSSIYIDENVDMYINLYENLSFFNLRNRVFPLSTIPKNDIVIHMDGWNFNQNTFELFRQLPSIIKDSGSVGEFELGCFRIQINRMIDYSKNLIHTKDKFYTSKLLI